MSKVFYRDLTTGQSTSYVELLKDLTSATHYNLYCRSKDYYVVFKSIVLSLLLNQEIILLDDDLSQEEVESQVGKIQNSEVLISEVDRVFLSRILTLDELFENITKSQKNWRITLFTSGTTGIPKMISHDFTSITRSVKQTNKHTSSVWGFAYNSTHMAGIQVFFQALLNKNTIVKLFKLEREDILKEINDNKITHISATPTFYRLLLPVDQVCPSVERLTSGGERFDRKVFESLSRMFPNASIVNVYASTEAGTVFASDGDTFSVKPNFKNLVKFENDELYLHKTIMGSSNTIQLQQNEWYATGDLIQIISKDPIRFIFISRKNEMINVGGYKVNPGEVEDVLKMIDGIKQVRVYGKKNSLLGNIICADILRTNSEITELDIRAVLQNKIQDFKIPRVIKFVESIETTRTGKIKRN